MIQEKDEQYRLRQSEANLRFVLNNSDTAYVLLDTQMRIVMANTLANRWCNEEFGKVLDEGILFLDFIPHKYKQTGAVLMQNALNGTPYSYEDKFVKNNGITSWYNVRFNAIRDRNGVITGLCIAVNETTHYLNAQAEAKAMNNLLESKVRERTTELETANKELEAFTYSVSHDLMAPLRIIDGFSQVLLDDYKHKLDQEGVQTLEIIKRNATRMGELVNDLLNLARLGRTNLVKRSVNMNELVTSVIDELRFSTNKLDAKIKLYDLKPADCDPTLIKQVWSNLLSNAIKYSKKIERPQIEIGCMAKNGRTVYFVKDNGVGFDMQFAGKLFGVFQRLHKPNEFPGTGVGLAIVHRIITRHGGKVWAEAKVNEGATFYFII